MRQYSKLSSERKAAKIQNETAQSNLEKEIKLCSWATDFHRNVIKKYNEDNTDFSEEGFSLLNAKYFELRPYTYGPDS